MLSLVKMNWKKKSLRETIENVKAQLMDRPTLKLSCNHKNLHTDNIHSWVSKKLLLSLQDYPKIIIRDK